MSRLARLLAEAMLDISPKNHPVVQLTTTKRLLPGVPGTKRLLERYGDSLVCVRYRHSAESNQRFSTVELLVETRIDKYQKDAWLRVGYGETTLRQEIKAAGGKWDTHRKLWQLPLATIREMGLEKRIVKGVQ